MHTYAEQIPRKYSGVTERKEDEADDKEQIYTTNEGDVLISLVGTGVFIGEGFDLALARKLRDTIASVQGVGPMQKAAAPFTEPSLSIAHVLASFGAVNAGALERYTSRGSSIGPDRVR
jgi:hypothetical protein